jgi:hypothetical protein
MTRILDGFVTQFNGSAELPQMTAGWNRTILVQARDAGWTRALRVEHGAVAAMESPPATAEIVLVGPSDTLASIFRGEISPTEPYMDGTLLVQSTEADMMKLDVFTLMVWGE